MTDHHHGRRPGAGWRGALIDGALIAAWLVALTWVLSIGVA
jgi:hypothetical protein